MTAIPLISKTLHFGTRRFMKKLATGSSRGLLGSDAVCCCGRIPVSEVHAVSVFSVDLWKWNPTTTLHDVTTQKTST